MTKRRKGADAQRDAAFDARVARVQRCVDILVHRLVFSEQALIKTGAAHLNLSERKTISFVGRKPGCNMKQLATYLMAPTSTATSVVDNLVTKALVRRSRSELDRRVVCLELTKRGQRLFAVEEEKFRQLGRSLLEPLATKEQMATVLLLEKIVGDPST